MYKMKCPRCGKRAFDISVLSKIPVIIELKCPNCRNLVKVPCKAEMCIADKR